MSQADREKEWKEFREAADRDALEDEKAEEQLCEEMNSGRMRLEFSSQSSLSQLPAPKPVEIKMRDGVILRGTLTLPATEGQHSTILHRGPYDEHGSVDWTPLLMRELASRGYACLAEDVRGRYQSDGVFHAFENEAHDGADTIDWISKQPWSNGKVGTTGVSYAGWSCYAAALEQPPALKCTIPAMVGYETFQVKTPNTIALDAGTWSVWAGQPTKELQNIRRIDMAHLPLSEITAKAGFNQPLFNKLISSRHRDGTTWNSGNVEVKNLKDIKIPTLVVCGWYDELLTDALRAWNKLRNAQLIIGPWHHNLVTLGEARIGNVPTKEIPLRYYYDRMQDFFDSNLNQVESKYASDKVAIFVMGRNEWRVEPEWPLSRAIEKSLYFVNSGDSNVGSLSSEKDDKQKSSSQYVYDPLNVSSEVPSSWDFINDMGSYPDVVGRSDRLAFRTSELTNDLEVTGVGKVSLYVQSSAETTDFVARLIDIYPSGHRQYLTHGVITTSYQKNASDPMLMDPEKIYELDIPLSPTSNVFCVGHRLEIEISSVDFPRYARNQNIHDPDHTSAECKTAQQTIHHSSEHPTRLIIPVIET